MPIEQISNNGYSMYLDNGSLFESRDLAQKRQLEQNALARQQSVRNVLAANIDPATGQTNWQKAYAMGGQDVAPELQASQQADLMAQAELSHKRGLGTKANLDAQGEYWKQQRDVAARLGDQSSWSTWRSTLPAEFQPIVPEEFSEDNKRKTIATADDLLKTHFQQVDTNGGGYTLRMPEIGGGPATEVPGSRYFKTMSPDEQSRIDREFNPNNIANITTNDQGDVRFWNKQGGEVKPGAGKGAGKPAGAVITARQKAEQLRKDINTTITEFENILKPGGLLDKSTGSGAGAMVDAAAGFIGKATEGSIAIGQLQPIADLSLKLVPRFEGPQSDADTTSYKEASANVANPKLPVAVRKAAAATVLRILKKRQAQFGAQGSDGAIAPAAAAPAVGTIEDNHRFKGGDPADSKNWEPI